MIGIDVVQVERMERLITRPGFLRRVFTTEEGAYIRASKHPAQTAAGLFAAKEAIAKAMGTSVWNVLRTVAITHVAGRPVVRGLPLTLSITHDGGFAVAVVLDGRERAPGEIWADQLATEDALDEALLRRDAKGHKSQFGRVAVIGGAQGMAGAVSLSSMAALRAGAGLVITVVPQSIGTVVQTKLLEPIVRVVSDEEGKFSASYLLDAMQAIEGCNALALGPGLGRGAGVRAFVQALLEKIHMPCVIDADGLNALTADFLHRQIKTKKSGTQWILTPHEMEFHRLSGNSLASIRADRTGVAMRFARETGTVVILKGQQTVITDGQSYYLNPTGNPGLATAGAGDVLTGILVAFLGQGYPPIVAARLASYIHGLAADAIRVSQGEEGLIASDLIDMLPKMLHLLHERQRRRAGWPR